MNCINYVQRYVIFCIYIYMCVYNFMYSQNEVILTLSERRGCMLIGYDLHASLVTCIAPFQMPTYMYITNLNRSLSAPIKVATDNLV